ncbi:MAG TPA: lysophospholipid acyltransferase family protein [Ktedonobacterales bacterium]|nr:lysophospholipid acyltransferase family protein [Ktedonobacterales bacterium]
MTKLRAFHLAEAIVPFIPMWLAYPGARFIGMLVWAFHGQLRRRVERNLRHVPRLVSDPVALHRATRGVFEHMVLNYLDFLRGPHLTEKEVLAGWTTDGEELINEAIERGNGLIIVSAHFGNFEYGVSRLGSIGYHMTTPVERMRPEALYQWVCKTREHFNLRLLPADSRETLREMRNALKRNELVVVAADRYIIGSSIEVPFFGEPARLPTSPFALALKTGAPIVGSFSWRLGRGRSHGVVIPLDIQPEPKDSEGDGNAATRARSEEATARAVGKYVEQLERLITMYPEQWVSTLATIWDTEDTQETRENVEQQRVAASVAPATANNQSARSSAVPST